VSSPSPEAEIPLLLEFILGVLGKTES